jgi:hypothetical protein
MSDLTTSSSIGLLSHADVATGRDPGFDILRLDPTPHPSSEAGEQASGALSQILQQRRRQGRPPRLLVDRRHMLCPSADVAERFLKNAKQLTQPGDRVAMIVESTLARLHLRRVLEPATHRIYATEAEAVAWLEKGD